MGIVKQKEWEKCEKINQDPYGKCCVNVAREVMRMLDTPEYEKFCPHKIVCQADKNINAGGITGFMAGCVIQMVKHCGWQIFKK